MKNNYRIIDYKVFGLPQIEVYGDQFCFLDLYELVGKHQFMTTFNLKKDSESYTKYGVSVLGVIHFNHTTLKAIETSDKKVLDLENVQIDSAAFELSQDVLGDLKYEGIKISDIEFISFLPYALDTELHDTGEKKVPNIVNVEVDFKELKIDADQLQLSFLTMKNNDGVELIDYEKEQIIGLTLGMNDGHIDSRVLAHFGFDKDSMENNLNIMSCYYGVKDRRKTLSNKQKERYLEIQNILNMQKTIMVLQEMAEILKSKVNADELKLIKESTLKLIMDAAIKFRPSVLLHGKKQIYWDLESYLHIVMRHVKHYQTGNFKEKTLFSYKPEELKDLIERVINRVKNEYIAHVLKYPDRNFTRQGKMAVQFNGDHYNLRVAPDGRLIQFHALEAINME